MITLIAHWINSKYNGTAMPLFVGTVILDLVLMNIIAKAFEII